MIFGPIFFAVAVMFFIVSYTGSTVVDNVINKPVVNESSQTIVAFQGIDKVTARFDYVGLGVFVGLVLAVIVTGWFVGGHPIFMIAYILLVAISVAITAMLANAWESITAFAKFTATLASFPIVNHLVLNLPLYVGVVGFIGIVVMFAKPYFMDQGVI